MEQMQYNLLFRWFVGIGIDDPVWVPTVFTKNRDRLLNTEMSRKVMAAILAHREVKPLLSDDHFSVDGTLVKAWASMKSFRPKVEGSHPRDLNDPHLRRDQVEKLADVLTHHSQVTPTIGATGARIELPAFAGRCVRHARTSAGLRLGSRSIGRGWLIVFDRPVALLGHCD